MDQVKQQPYAAELPAKNLQVGIDKISLVLFGAVLA